MNSKKQQKEETKNRIIEAATRTFKKSGYSGIGVDSLAKEAGVTSGAFYVHFKSKAEAFRAAAISGLKDVQNAIIQLREAHHENWWNAFAKLYMGDKRTCDLNESCPLQTLTPEVGRFDDDTKAAYEIELKKVIELASSDSTEENKDKIWTNIAMLIGGVTLARAVKDETTANEIAKAIEKNIYQI
ncbi:TetR/AcrR family transcriptional regulator [Sulfurimonas sp.]|uniref:TetR/AcrR family transcriptional regulator n=1 Tax=Sulfurimonas sp. TaxID=2022749 RepID=UPI0019F9F66F|nr:TetR/AcrR family transcriptional regulator [Sulfurimonas sp.]MBE0515541.1 TetR/AcrR family transcriptional regulator [Sulfurimonas sp.]